jgi:hypothetical protein
MSGRADKFLECEVTNDGRNLRKRMYCVVSRLLMFALREFDVDELKRYTFLVKNNHDGSDRGRGAPAVEFENHV